MNKKINNIKKKTLYSGFYQLHELTFKHKKHDGSWSIPITREVFSGGHVATVIPYDPSSKKIVHKKAAARKISRLSNRVKSIK